MDADRTAEVAAPDGGESQARTSAASRMTPAHLVLALLVVTVWSTNFVVIKHALKELPPLLFATLRFVVCALPWIFLVPRPAIPMRKIALLGVLQGSGQFGLLFLALRADISAGLAPVVVQSQVFFTILGAAVFLHEPINRLQGVALGVAAVAFGMIAVQGTLHASETLTLAGLALTLGAGLCWAASNLIARTVGRVNMLHLLVWSSVFAVPALLALSVLVDGAQADLEAIHHASLAAWSAVAWQSFGNTFFGFGVWNWLLVRYPAASVTPVALLVPVLGMLTAAVVTGETFPAWKLSAGALLIFALVANTYAALAPRSRIAA